MATAEIGFERRILRKLLPLTRPARYKGASGGRGSGKSHFFAEAAVEAMVRDPDLRFVCIREVQRSLKFSAKALIESKIREMGVSDFFEVLTTEIRSRYGTGVMIFEGMQDHTADSIKSLEAFRRAWVEEAQSLSARSLSLLIPTIRAAGSELWFSWNPDQPDDPVDKHFQQLDADGAGNFCRVRINYTDNPLCEPELVEEAERMRRVDPDAYAHIWLGEYNVKSDAKVLAGKYRVEDFEPEPAWEGPYYGSDHGFAMDPRVLIKCWRGPHPRYGRNCLYVENESHHVKLDIDRTAQQWEKDIPGFSRYVVRADSAEPGTNAYLKRHGVPRIEGVDKWKGSIEDGIAHLRQYDMIIIHTRCKNAQDEARLYSYKIDKHTGDILPDIEDAHNHIWDAVRYALSPFIKPVKIARFG